jgi:putative DNA primase/helicase
MSLNPLPGVSTDKDKASINWHAHTVLVFNGSRDTNIHGGRDYRTRTLEDIFEDDTPASVDKEDAPAFIPSSYKKFDARKHEVQREQGLFVCLTGDLDKGNHNLEEVAELVEAFAGPGTAYRVYSSASATDENQKWRVLIPLVEPVPFQAWQDLQWSLIKYMESEDVKLDTALTRAGQPVYLPNVPTAKRESWGEPLFHQNHTTTGQGFDLENSEIASQWLGAAEADRWEAEEEATRVRAAAKIKTAKRVAGGVGSPIDKFNDEHDVEGLMESYGYKPGPGRNWRSPMQTSSSCGTMVIDQHWISVSGSDREAGLGSATKDGHSHGDAFDLFLYFEHKGDRTAALKAWSPRGGSKPGPCRTPAPAAAVTPDNGQDSPEVVGEGEVEAPAPHLSEIALAEEFAARGEGLFRWSPGMDWMHNKGSHWVRDIRLQRSMLAKSICKGAADTAERPQLKAKTASSSTTTSVLSLARSEPGIITDVNEWDINPMVLNTPGDAYDLSTGLPVSREGLLLIQVAGVAPTKTPTPVWDKFVNEVFGGDVDMVEFIQRLGGYALTGSVKEQKLFYLYGSGANGKSVFLEVLRSISGSYAHNLPSEALMTSKHERHPTSFAALQGKRLAISCEMDDGMHWAEAKIKSLTGDPTITARFMRGDDFEFAITHKHILAGNFKPRLKGDDFAMARRMVLVPFNQTFQGARRDDGLSEKLKGEYSGILQWFIEGARKWSESGLKIPALVLEASKEYMSQQNDIALWIEEQCEVGPMLEDTTKNLYASYVEWKAEQGEKPQAKKTWSERMENAKFERLDRTTGSRDRGFRGLKLLKLSSSSTKY